MDIEYVWVGEFLVAYSFMGFSDIYSSLRIFHFSRERSCASSNITLSFYQRTRTWRRLVCLIFVGSLARTQISYQNFGQVVTLVHRLALQLFPQWKFCFRVSSCSIPLYNPVDFTSKPVMTKTTRRITDPESGIMSIVDTKRNKMHSRNSSTQDEQEFVDLLPTMVYQEPTTLPLNPPILLLP